MHLLPGPQTEPRNFIPRAARERLWSRRASDAVYAQGGNAMAAALAAIDAGFGAASVHNGRKRRVERLINLGFDHQEVCLRFQRYALIRGLSLDGAIKVLTVDRDALADRAQRKARAWGTKAPAVADNVNDELLMCLRFIRRFAPAAWRRAMVPFSEAAE